MVEWGEERDRLNAIEYAKLRELHVENGNLGSCQECGTRWPCRSYRILVREPPPSEPPLIDQMVRTYYARRTDSRTPEESMAAVLFIIRGAIDRSDAYDVETVLALLEPGIQYWTQEDVDRINAEAAEQARLLEPFLDDSLDHLGANDD